MKIKELLHKSIWVLIVRAIGAILMFLLTVTFARWLGVSDFGLFSLGLMVMNILGLVSRWGVDQVLLKQVGSCWESDPGMAKGYMIAAIKLVSIISTGIALLIFVFHDITAIYIFNKPEFSELLLWFGVMTVPFSVNYIIAEVYKSIGKPVMSSYLQSVITPFIAILSGGCLVYLDQLDLLTLTQGFALGVLLSLCIGMLLFRKVIYDIVVTTITLKNIAKEGRAMFILASGGLIMAWSDVFILGILGTSSELGVYSAASKTVLASSLILFVMNSVTAPKYAKLYKMGDITSIERLAQNSSKILFVAALFPTVFLFLFPDWVMSWFGDDFVIGASVLMILAFGQFINVALGSVGYILVMTNNHYIFRKILFIIVLLNILLSVILFQIIGVIGVALATATAIILLNVALTLAIRKKLGFWSFKI